MSGQVRKASNTADLNCCSANTRQYGPMPPWRTSESAPQQAANQRALSRRVKGRRCLTTPQGHPLSTRRRWHAPHPPSSARTCLDRSPHPLHTQGATPVHTPLAWNCCWALGWRVQGWRERGWHSQQLGSLRLALAQKARVSCQAAIGAHLMALLWRRRKGPGIAP
jgi:hypothetical protein